MSSKHWRQKPAPSVVNCFQYLPMPSGIVSNKFWEMTKSVNEVKPLISSGSLSSLFSETSKHSRFFRFPISYINDIEKETHA